MFPWSAMSRAASTPAGSSTVQNGSPCLQHDGILADVDPGRRRHFAHTTHQARPSAFVDLLDEEYIECASGLFPRPQPRGDHLRIVDDEKVIVVKQPVYLPEEPMVYSFARPVEDEKARRGALPRGRLRDQLLRQKIIERFCPHTLTKRANFIANCVAAKLSNRPPLA